MSNHTPTKPTDKILNRVKQIYTFDIEKGLILDEVGVSRGSPNDKGYIVISVYKRQLKRAHLIFWAATGEWPTTLIDHENRIRDDDRFENLRPLDSLGNAHNSTYKVGKLPVGLCKTPYGKYVACIERKGKRIYLGTRNTPEEASKLYEEARTQL